MDILFVCLMGMGIVFLGLICLIILCSMMSAVIGQKGSAKADAPAAVAAPVQTPASAPSDELSPEKRREMIAAVSCVLAEELGKDVSAIRVISFKKI